MWTSTDMTTTTMTIKASLEGSTKRKLSFIWLREMGSERRDNSEKFRRLRKNRKIGGQTQERARARERELSCWLRRKTIKMWFYKQKTPSNIISETDINIKCDYWRVQLAGYILMCRTEETHTLFIVNRDEHAGGVQTRKTSRPISHSSYSVLFFFCRVVNKLINKM